jgi:hypothetical protein
VVIGNPPYIRIQTMKEWAPLEVELYKKQYAAASQGNDDIYVVFVEKGLRLLMEDRRYRRLPQAEQARPVALLQEHGAALARFTFFL